jgi:hypothetical protein
MPLGNPLTNGWFAMAVSALPKPQLRWLCVLTMDVGETISGCERVAGVSGY